MLWGKRSRGVVRVVWVTLTVIATTVLLIAACLGVLYWGIVHMNDKSAAEIHQVETATTVAIKNRFANIRSVEIHSTTYDAMTGTYGLDITATNIKGTSMRFIAEHSPSDPNSVGGWHYTDYIQQQVGKTTTPVRVTYSDGTKGEV